MSKRLLANMSFLVLGLVLATLFQPFAALRSFAQTAGCQTFPETGKTVCGRFLEYWQKNGGLAQQGYPMSGPFTEVSELNGQTYTVQYFERSVFELHPENQPPNDVLLSQLGAFQFKRKYPNGEPSGGSTPPAPPPAQPPSGVAGQTLDVVGAFEQTLHITAQKAEETGTLSGKNSKYTAKGKYVVIYVRVTNTGSQVSWIHDGTIKLVDDKDRRYNLLVYSEASVAAEQYYRDYPGTFIEAGLSAEEVFLFETASDAANYRLIPAQQ